MDNRSLSNKDILKHFGGIHANSLNNIFQDRECDYEIETIGPSHYYSPENLHEVLKETSSKLIVISLNAQSILAKFNSLEIMLDILNKQNIWPDVILIQESWLKNDDFLQLIQMEGYTCISQSYKCSNHGGLVTYVKSKYSKKILDICPESLAWEGLFVEISSQTDKNSKFIAGNIYKPPRDNNNYENIQNFIHKFEPVVNFLNNSKLEYLIGGDWNINLLKQMRDLPFLIFST